MVAYSIEQVDPGHGAGQMTCVILTDDADPKWRHQMPVLYLRSPIPDGWGGERPEVVDAFRVARDECLERGIIEY